MNKKGKNKKGKVPNPSPSQEEKNSDKVEGLEITLGDKREEVGIIGEVVPKLEEKSESVEEKRVPEIVSENITPPVEFKDEETPKKPKRNRGKKKKGKDDDFDDNLEEKTKEPIIKPPVEETKVDIVEFESKQEESPSPIITPTTRKKKNKKKTEQKSEEPVLPDQGVSDILTETEIKTPEIKELIYHISDSKQEFEKTEELEIKPSKKKNKKKKRSDSERSDKEEFSCTSAFQKILDDKEEPLEIKMEEKPEDPIIPPENNKNKVGSADIILAPTKEIIPIQAVIEKASTPIKDEEEVKETITDTKGKKKNKKDKKHTAKLEEISKQEVKPDQTPTLIDFEIPSQSVNVEPTKEIPISIPEGEDKNIATVESLKSVEDLSLKPKAKIAKPVEKKRKGKHDAQTIESMQHDISEPLKVQKESDFIKPESTETKTKDKDKISVVVPQGTQFDISSDIALMVPSEDEKLMAQEFELVAEKAVGKKRKKESKMPKALDIGSVIPEQKMETDTKKTDSKEDINKETLAVITEILTPQIDQQEFVIMSEKSDIPITIDTVKQSKDVTKILKPEFQGKILLTPENIASEKEFTKIEEGLTQQTEDKHKTEQKPGKKRKKSPKPPKKIEVVTEITERPLTPKPEEITKETFKSEEFTQKSLAEKIDASNITRMYDIEISSIQTDVSEGTVIDTIPDITYPRASSQQLRDDNNNTVIREIFSSEETAPVTLLTPGFPQSPKKNEATGISSKEEKTDLKSKMMEVNQDMEELRLSIERSLAELSSIEKNESKIEKEFEVTRAKAKNTSNLLFEKNESPMQMSSDKVKPTEHAKEALGETKTIAVTKDSNIQQLEEKPQVEIQITKGDQTKINVTAAKLFDKTAPVVETNNPEVSLIIDSQPIVTTPVPEAIIMPPADIGDNKSLVEKQKVLESLLPPIPLSPVEEKKTEIMHIEQKDIEPKSKETQPDETPVCPARKDNKGKHKKKKGKQESQTTSVSQSTPSSTQSQTTQETKKEEKTESKTESKSDSKDKSQSKEKGKQQSSNVDSQEDEFSGTDYDPIENFEDALTSSADDVNKTFEMMVKESQEQNNPKINIIAPDEEKTPVSPPKNLLGHPDIPVRSNRRDFKKEKDKLPNEITAKVKIKDSVEVERKQSKNTQTITKMKEFCKDYKIDDNEDFVYKYSFRKVYLQSSCHVCKKDLKSSRVPCGYCSLLFYCSNKHKDEDWPQHQALCFAVSTIVHLKDQKHIYADAKNLTGHDYRLIRMQMIVSCEKVLKRRLVPWEQEALLYPRICAHVPCREWRQGKLSDCQGCGQISFCTDKEDHFPKSHSRWCKSYSLYEKLVCYQQTKGRLEPKMPTKVLQEPEQIPEKINEVLASMYEEKIDISDIQYAALTQVATAPLTAAYCHQLCGNKLGSTNGVYKKSSFTIHVVGAELQFEADALNKWEVFFLHLRPDLQELRVVLINYNLNPSNLPLELLGKIKLCENCRQNKRRVVLSFQDKRTYTDYKSSEDFVLPDIVCAFNPSIQRSSVYNGKDTWPTTINAILKLKVPFIITAYTITELHKDCIRVKECSESGYNFIAEPKYNNFASVRPDRNFISDEEMPLLFKNYCYAIVSG